MNLTMPAISSSIASAGGGRRVDGTAVAGTILKHGGRAIDLCGGSGHLTRELIGLAPEPPVIADLFFAKLWLAAGS